MSQRFSPTSWIIWTVASALVILVTRNPVYLGLTLIAILTVYLSLEHRSAIALAWSTVLRIGLVIAGISVLFNLLTVQSGDRQFGSLPASWSIIGGPLTWNAVVYGAISGAALICLLLIAATLSTAVERAALVRLVPPSFNSIGIAAAAALSIFPQTIHAISQVREAHRARGLQVRSVRDIQQLIVPVLNIGLERSFHLAESMESRAFGNRVGGNSISPSIAVGILFVFTAGVVLVSIGYPRAGLAMVILTGVALVVIARSRSGLTISRFREARTSAADIPILASSLAMIVLVLQELVRDGNTLAYSTYPQLELPPISVAVAIACLLPAVPTAMLIRTEEPERANA